MTFLTQYQDDIYKNLVVLAPWSLSLSVSVHSNVLCWPHSYERFRMQGKIDLLTASNFHAIHSFSGRINWSSISYTQMPTFCDHGHDYCILLCSWDLIELRM